MSLTFPIVLFIWESKLQTEISLSKMESDINALAHSCRELSPIIDIKKSPGQTVGLPIGDTTMNVSIHEDNAGALILSKTLPPQFTPRSKYYASKTIWFREEINKREIKLLKIDRYTLVTFKVSLLKSKYVHGIRPCHTNVIIISSYYQPLFLV